MNAKQVIADIYIDRDAPVPLHYQIQVCLENCLKSGQLDPGDRLPNLTDFSRILNVSHVTALKAITELQKKGLLISKRGVGTIVAPKRTGATDVIIPSKYGGPPPPGSERWSINHQLRLGVEKGLNDPERPISVNYMSNAQCTPAEFLSSLRARRVDSVIAYQPIPEFFPMLSAVGHEITTVSLMTYLPGTPVHCVTADVEGALVSMLERRLAAGRRDFAYVAFNPADLSQPDPEETNPYRKIYMTFQETLSKAGIQPTEHVISNVESYKLEAEGSTIELRKPDGIPLNPGAVIVIQFPSLLRYISPPTEDADIISYTEIYRSVELHKGNISLIYFGVDESARAACGLIKDQVVPGVGQRGQIVREKPKVYDRALSEAGV